MSLEYIISQGWTKNRKGEITKQFQFDDFYESMQFVNRVADIAERHDHHPDILIQYDKVTISCISHDVGKVTDRDYRLATKITEAY